MPTFPTLTVQFGFNRRFANIHAQMPHGYRYTHNVSASGKYRWMCSGVVSDADLATLEAFFAARKGRYESFDFVDPKTGTTYAGCRFDSDELRIEHRGPNENSVDFVIMEV